MATKPKEKKDKVVRMHAAGIGKDGIDSFMGFIQEAYISDLQWPSVQPLYSKIRRSDPEITIVRQLFTALARQINLTFALPDDASDDEKRAQEFGEQVLEDMDGGQHEFVETLVSNVPFYGWGWFEVLNALRSPDWRPPDANDPWRSQFDDGLIGIRRLAFRDTSTFKSWDIDDDTGRLLGMVQTRGIGEEDVTIPLENSLHVTFGDSNNPEGLSPLEAVYRLERIKYGLEVIQGIGFEHSAGYLDVTLEEKLTEDDKAIAKRAARNILTAQEGNYAMWPKGMHGEIKDINFHAAQSILKAIQYYGILKLSVYNSQWVALSATTGAGSYAAMDDSSSMFVNTYNAMMKGFVSQANSQVFRKLFNMNRLAWPQMERMPNLTFTPIDKSIELTSLGDFVSKMNGVIVFGDDDVRAIRQKSGILPAKIPDAESEGIKKESAKPPALSMGEKDSMVRGYQRFLAKVKTADPELYEHAKSMELDIYE